MKKYIVLLTFLLAFNLLFGQEQNYSIEYNYSTVQNFQAPSVATFNTYGKIPVSLYTGTPNVTIPIYTIEEQGLSIPIELRYNIHNVKPNIHTGIVGLGWNLFAGGSITRIQKGDYYDECTLNKEGAIPSLNPTKVESFLGNEYSLADNWKTNPAFNSMNVPANEPWYGEQRLYKDAKGGSKSFDGKS